MDKPPGSTIYLEMRSTPAGQQVFAIDPSDALEVSFVAPNSASEAEIERLAIAKLAYVRQKQANEKGDPKKPPRRGTVV